MEICVNCLVGFHLSCLTKSCDCALKAHQLSQQSSPTESYTDEQVSINSGNDTRESASRSRSGVRSGKRDAALKDQQSTGRKRAARMYPLDREASCEWKGLSNCGGGLKPILGCFDGKQQARHHGPDKSVSNNEEGNVHRICHCCHYRWHAANNKEYDWNNTLVNSHAPIPQSEQERQEALMAEMEYLAGKHQKVRD